MSLVKLSSGVTHGLERCPHCGVSTPLVSIVGEPVLHYTDGSLGQWYYTGQCSKCKNITLFYGYSSTNKIIANSKVLIQITVEKMYPGLELIPNNMPQRAARFYKQAAESMHAPDGAIMLAASAIDAMLKDKGFSAGSLYSRIEMATEQHVLTHQMKEWAHEIRLSANEPRHADENFEGASKTDAEQTLQFAKALGEYLYDLPSRIEKWKSKAGNQT
jgi:hypothetical protein